MAEETLHETDLHHDREREDDDRDRERIPRENSSSRDDMYPQRPLFVGNLDAKIRAEDVVKLFEDAGKKIQKVELKSGFAFVFLESGTEEAVAQLDGTNFFGKRLKIEVARGDGRIKQREDERRKMAQSIPNRTLFVVSFDPYETRERDLRNAFEPFGNVVRVDLRRNYAFVEFETVESASEALKNLNGSKLLDREITVEFCAGGAKGSSRRRSRSRSRSRSRGRSRSRSPRRRASPYRGASGKYGYGAPSPYYDSRYDDRYSGRYGAGSAGGAGGYDRYYDRGYGAGGGGGAGYERDYPRSAYDARYDDRYYSERDSFSRRDRDDDRYRRR